MRILFCSPCDSDPSIVVGGINVWARTVLGYYQSVHSGVEITPVSFDRRIDIKNDTGIVKRLMAALNEFPPAIIHARNELKTRNYAVAHIVTSASLSLVKDLIMIRLAHKYGTKVVIHFHFGRIPDLMISNGWESKLLRRVLKRADMLVTMDQKSFDALSNKGYNNIHYLPNPISESIIASAEEERKAIRQISGKLLFVGQVLPTKGVFELVEACKRINGIQLHIVGKAQDSIKEELAARFGRDNTKFLMRGALSREEVFREMMSSELFILPSYSEGFPNVVLEAMACHCPIIATTVGAIPEMLDVDGEACGVCVKPKDVEGLQTAITSLLNDKQKASDMSDKALIRVKSFYSTPVVWKQLVGIWKEAIA